MAALTTAIIGAIAAASAAAGTGYTIAASEEAKQKAEDAANQQKQEQDAAIAQAKAQQDKVATDAQTSTAADNSLFQRNKSRSDLAAAQASLGRSGTILTSPLGIPGTQAPGGKSVLGS